MGWSLKFWISSLTEEVLLRKDLKKTRLFEYVGNRRSRAKAGVKRMCLKNIGEDRVKVVGH